MKKNKIHFKLSILFLIMPVFLMAVPAKQKAEIHGNKVSFNFTDGVLQLKMCTPSMVKVTYAKGATAWSDTSLSVINTFDEPVKFSVKESGSEIHLTTAELKVVVNLKTRHVSFLKPDGSPILAETPGSRKISPVTVNGEKTFNLEQGFDWHLDEGLYGLGQHQNGVMNYRGHRVRLFQDNTIVAMPVLVSSRGYSLLWDNYSLSEFRDDKKGDIKSKENTRSGSIWSEAGKGICYYFIYGPQLDKVIAQYRKATGEAPLYGKWAYGLWQSKEHYHTQAELLNVVSEYRKRQIPLDNIVQDWFYWEPLPWGSHNFDRSRYPQPEAMVKELHEKYNTNIMVSVWARFSPGSPNYNQLNKQGYLFPTLGDFGNAQFYDPYNPKARDMYWKQIYDSLYVKGFDAWWLDATEPEIGNISKDKYKALMNNALGSGVRYLNSYPLMTTTAVYQGLRNTTSDRRAYILTRSAFTGQQRNAATTWSGDIHGKWSVFKNQVAAGINFCYTGIPYWTTDIGGFFVSDFIGGNKNDEYRELFTRWFQFGAFCPIFRVHGSSTPREMYYFGNPGDWAYDAQLEADELRYRLLPYIYSVASDVTRNGYTIMRGLNFDFSNDANVRNIADQYMFGPSFLVCPVTESMYHRDFTNPSTESEIIQQQYFTTPDNKPGLKAEYFKGTDFEQKLFERTDKQVDFTWKLVSPAEMVPVDYFSARWTGNITASATGDCSFITYADDGVRLWVNNQLIIDDWTQHDPVFKSGNIRLEKGKTYPIKLEFKEAIGGANVTLSWVPNSAQRELAKKEFEAKSKTVQSRSVYLPGNVNWFSFWTGASFAGGQTIQAAAPINQMPLFIKAGSIVPMGPFVQYASQKPADPIELRIYPGADGSFTLYEDENDNYNYEKGVFATIPVLWNDRNHTLTLGKRSGSFPGILQNRTFRVVLVSETKGNGLHTDENPDAILQYSGQEVSTTIR